MPEATADAAILIAASYQAMNRAQEDNPHTIACDSAVTIAFAGFYVEANLNHLIAVLGREADLRKEYGSNPGLRSKLAFFYNAYVAPIQLPKNNVYDRLEAEFPRITELADFRNDLCHGTMNQTMAVLSTARVLREHAKSIVEKLFTAANARTGRDLRRTLVNYWAAIGIQPPAGVPDTATNAQF